VNKQVCARGVTVKGVDVSHYQGHVNWASVKAAGYSFAFMKATEGYAHLDLEFARNWSACKANGIIRGAYHFFHPKLSPQAQADFFLQSVGPLDPTDLPMVLDWETTDQRNNVQQIQNALWFLHAIEDATKKRPLLYFSPGFFNALGNPKQFLGYKIWIANYGARCPHIPDIYNDWAFWQNAETGVVPGIQGRADVDLFNGSLADLQTFALKTS
jgi:lysozyme